MADRGPGDAGADVTIEAPAKVNLYLHVTGRRDDGLHLLDSLIAFAGVGDTISVSKAPGLELHLDGPFAEGIPAGDDNLVLRAARGLADLAGVDEGARIALTKRLPPSSGIGGGSADAAATLEALRRLWGFDGDESSLARLALSLGADVPICLTGRPSFVSGIGEEIVPAPPLPPAWMVLANPGVAVSTPAVFRARSASFSTPAPFRETPSDPASLALLLAERGNDLTAPALNVAPIIGDVLSALAGENPLLARMSGSGATCYALFGDEKATCDAAARLSQAHPQWWIAAAPMLGAGSTAP
jgi:4-diphosphocytidyl-2-C-methyl-D-erythritol kinase